MGVESYTSWRKHQWYGQSLVIDRLLSKIEISTPEFCWPYLGYVDKRGYGNFWFEGKNQYPHRIIYQFCFGNIPEDLVIDHECHNITKCNLGNNCLHRRCCNPFHLKAVPHKNNLINGRTWAAFNAAKTHCINGHEFTEENTRINSDGRACRLCGREAMRRYRLKNGN